MTKTLGAVLACALTLATPGQAENWRYAFPPPDHQILTLGTFHFKDAGLDSYKPEFDIDILSEPRQRELDHVLSCLAAFEPTKIALEVKTEHQAALEARYRAFLSGEFELSSNEIHQIGFRLAKRLGHERVYAVDAPPRWYEPYVDPDAWARKNFQGHLLESELVGRYEELYRSEDREKTEQPLLHTFLELNDTHRIRLGHGRYLIENFQAGNATEYPGVDSKTAWYNRNLRIFANLQRIVERDEERILFIVGAGHLPILTHAIESSPEFSLARLSSHVGLACAPEPSVDASSQVEISEISELVFNAKLGKLITRDESWNHGYPRNDLDSSLLLSVLLSGEPGSYSFRHRLHALARVGDEVLLDRSFAIGSFSAEGEYTIPILLNGPLCDTVELRASLETDGRVLDTKTFDVVYTCGE